VDKIKLDGVNMLAQKLISQDHSGSTDIQQSLSKLNLRYICVLVYLEIKDNFIFTCCIYGHVHQIYVVLCLLVSVKVFFRSTGTLPFNHLSLSCPDKAQPLTVIDTHTHTH